MAREVQIKTWCDIHLQKEDERVEGREIVVALGRAQPKTLTVCPDHEAEFVAPFLGVFEEYAIANPDVAGSKRSHRKRETTPIGNALTAPAEGEHVCPECPHLSYATRLQLSAHARRAHDKSIAELLGEPAPYVCDDCDRTFGKPQALAVHQSRSHKVA